MMENCNNLTVYPKDYEVLTNNSVCVPVLNRIFTNFVYLNVSTGVIQICYPLYDGIRTCTLFDRFQNNYVIKPDYTLHDKLYSTSYPPDRYYIDDDKFAHFCPTSSYYTTPMNVFIILSFVLRVLIVSRTSVIVLRHSPVGKARTYRLNHVMCLGSFYFFTLLRYVFYPPFFCYVFCTLVAFCILWSYLSALLWLNIIAFSLYHKIRDYRLVTSEGEQEKAKIWTYLYAYLPSFAIAMTSFLVDHLAPEDSMFRARMQSSCSPDMQTGAAWVFKFMPVIAIMAINAVLIVLIIRLLLRHKRELLNGVLEDSRQSNISYVLVYCKLVVLLEFWYTITSCYMIFRTTFDDNPYVVILIYGIQVLDIVNVSLISLINTGEGRNIAKIFRFCSKKKHLTTAASSLRARTSSSTHNPPNQTLDSIT